MTADQNARFDQPPAPPQQVLDDAVDTQTQARQAADGMPEPLVFDGFATGHPLLVERPRLYMQRCVGSLRRLVVPPAGDTHHGIEGRTLVSPLVALPVAMLYGDEALTMRQASWYPLLYVPVNHPYDERTSGTEFDVFMLTVIIGLYRMHRIEDTPDRGLLVRPTEDPAHYTIPDDVWETSAAWVHDHGDDLAAVNLGRMLAYAVSDVKTEGDALTRLFALWGVDITYDEVLDDSVAAAQRLEQPYKELFGTTDLYDE